MLIQWPDRFYHTSADTPDRTDHQSLARAGSLAAAYAYWLATAGVEETVWLGHEMVTRFKARVLETAQAAVTEALSLDEGEALAKAIIGLDRRLAYLLDRHRAALESLERLAPIECLLVDLQSEAERAMRQELSWARGAVDLHAASVGLESLPMIPARTRSEQEQEASGLIPRRQVRGPVSLRQHIRHLDDEVREAWWRLLQERKDRGYQRTLVSLALYWADGARSVLEIADLVEMETGQRDVELLLAYFRLLVELGLVHPEPSHNTSN
jgi:hypothetical protein